MNLKDEVISKDFARAVGLDGKNIEISGIINPKQKQEIKDAITKIMETSNMFYEYIKLPPDRQFITQLSEDNDFYITW